MKFSQKLVCIMLLVIAAFFAVGGAVLVNGSFMDRLSAAAEQEQSMHAMLCGVVEDYYAVPQLPERCLSRKAGIVRCCLRNWK